MSVPVRLAHGTRYGSGQTADGSSVDPAARGAVATVGRGPCTGSTARAGSWGTAQAGSWGTAQAGSSAP